MYPSVDLCRVQEALQRRRAESAPLGIVRTIAQKAAAAWAAEALYAEGREQRQAQVRAFRADEIQRERAACEQLDLASSENPDRGRAAPRRPAASLGIWPRPPIFSLSRFQPEPGVTAR